MYSVRRTSARISGEFCRRGMGPLDCPPPGMVCMMVRKREGIVNCRTGHRRAEEKPDPGVAWHVTRAPGSHESDRLSSSHGMPYAPPPPWNPFDEITFCAVRTR